MVTLPWQNFRYILLWENKRQCLSQDLHSLLQKMLCVQFLLAMKPTALVELCFPSFLLFSFGPKRPKQCKQVVLAIDFKYEVRSDLWGYLEVTVSSKTNVWSSHKEQISRKVLQNHHKFLQKSSSLQIKISISLMSAATLIGLNLIAFKRIFGQTVTFKICLCSMIKRVLRCQWKEERTALTEWRRVATHDTRACPSKKPGQQTLCCVDCVKRCSPANFSSKSGRRLAHSFMFHYQVNPYV